MKISQLSSALMSVVLMSAPCAALAAVFTCTGLVRGVSIESGGDILAESIGSVIWPRLCNIRTTSNSIAPESCKIMYSSLLAAQTAGKSVTFWVNDPSTTCATMPQWQFVSGLYFLKLEG